jgi:hypothetical protein
MIRMQIGLDRREYDLARMQAAALGISVAELIRRAVRQTLPAPGEAEWAKYSGFAAGADMHSGQSVENS